MPYEIVGVSRNVGHLLFRNGALRYANAPYALRIELIAAEREFIHRLLRDGKLTDESRRRIERELDLEEESIACRREGETPM